MIIREANRDDLNELCQLFDSYRIFYRKTSDIEGAKCFLDDRLENGDSIIFVSEAPNNKLTGFVQLYPLFTSTNMKRSWLLNDLFVDADYRGQGISKRLIEKAKQLVIDTGAYGMFLETEKNNDIGNRLYPSVGMRINDKSNYYEWVV